MKRIKEIMVKYQNILIGVIALLCMYGLTLNSSIEVAFHDSFDVNFILAIALWVMLYQLIKSQYHATNDKRLKICSGVLAFLFALFAVVGKSLDLEYNFYHLLTTKVALIKTLLQFFSFWIVIYCVVMNLFLYWNKAKEFRKEDNKKITKIKSGWLFLLCFLLFFLAWLPYFLQHYPGILSPDSISQVAQSVGKFSFSNHHPITHTLVISMCLKIGLVFGSYQAGIACYSILQMMMMALVFAYSIYYMCERNFSKRLIILAILFYAFYPINAIYSITMWKDIPFSLSLLLLTINLVELYDKKEMFWKSIKNVTFLIFSMLIVMVFKNNGVYIVLLTIPFFLIFERKSWKKVLLTCTAVVGIYFIYKGFIFRVLNVKPTESVEALAIPLQQIARIERDNFYSLTEEEQNAIKKYIISPRDMAQDYSPIISDPVKEQLDVESYQKDKIGFLALCIKLAIKHPKTTLLAFLYQNYGYWYPEIDYWKYATGIATNAEIASELKIKTTPITHSKTVDLLTATISYQKVPLLSLLFSIGFAFWIIIGCVGYTIYQKNYRLLLMFVPILLLWLTCIASPVFGEYRYAYGLFICIPLLVGKTMKPN